jgi:protein-S-isoprenylcysteine O-methyltransferase Ste14
MKDGMTHGPKEGQLTEWLLRAFAVLVMGFIVARWGYAWWIDPTRWTALLLLVSEGYTLMLILLARRAIERDVAPLAMMATIYASFAALLLAPNNTIRLAPEAAGATLQMLSLAWVFVAKIALGRSFGLLPAQRGLVMVGPYRIVRHPIYLGYLFGHIGFLLANFSWPNAAVLALLYVAQGVRIQREESVLSKTDAAYAAYQHRVRWRLLPFVY